MRVICRIGGQSDSKKVLIKGIDKVVNGRIFASCILGWDDDAKNYYELIKRCYNPREGHYQPNELIPRKEHVYLVESATPEDCTFIEANGYTKQCVHLGGDKFMMFERVKLWDNNITGLNCLSHVDNVGKFGATIFKVGNTAKNVTYYKTIGRDEFLKEYNDKMFRDMQPLMSEDV